VILHTKYTERRLNDSTAVGWLTSERFITSAIGPNFGAAASIFSTARAENRRKGRLSALRAHTKAP
jgi:hypothetical protein